MRIASSTFMVVLATIFAAAAAQEDWSGLEDYETFFDPDGSREIRTAEYIEYKASIAAATTPTRRCDPDFVTRVNTVQKKRIADFSVATTDGCIREYIGLQGTRREKGTDNPGSDCDNLKTTFKGTGTDALGRNATLSSTETSSSEESRHAFAIAVDAKNRDTGYDSPSRRVQNDFYNTTSPFDQTGIVTWTAVLCSDAQMSPSESVSCSVLTQSTRIRYVIINPTNQTYKGLKATVLMVKMFRPKGSPRIALPSIGTGNDAPGAIVNVTTLTMPVVRRTLPPNNARMTGQYSWNVEGVVPTGQANLTITSGNDVICTATNMFP